MQAIRFGLRALWRDARAGELLVLGMALVIAAATVTAIGFLTDRIGQAVAGQAAEVLAADVRLRSPKPIANDYQELATGLDLENASMMTFPSMVFRMEDNVLAEVKAVSKAYPLRGRLRISKTLGGVASETEAIPDVGTVWLDTALLARLGANTGEEIELGSKRFTIAAVLNFRPDQSPGFSGFAPTLLMNIEDVAATGLVREGSRVGYAQLFAGAPGSVREFVQQVKTDRVSDVRVEDRGDVGQALNNAINRASRFLGLASIVSILLSAVAVAISARRYAQRRLDTAALMKCIGSQQGFILTSSLTQVVAIGLIASVIGAAIGFGAERLLTSILGDLLRNDLPAPTLRPIWMGITTVLILLIGFAMPSLMQLSTTPPARVLRHDLSPPTLSAWVTYGLAIVALGAMVYWSVRDTRLLAVILGGTLATAIVLYLVGKTMVALVRLRSKRVGIAWRYGLANIARRGSESAIQIVSFGLGLTVLLILTLVRNDLLSGWRATLDANAPNHFFINIQPHERDGVSEIMQSAGLPEPGFVPLVRARMTQVNGENVADRVYASQRGRRLANRDANLTFAESMGSSNTLVSGKWWSDASNEEPQVSVEVDAARDMNIVTGDELTIDVAGEKVTARVTSLRTVEWDSFEPNFFMVFSPQTLEDYPKTYITSLNVPTDKRDVLVQLVRELPSISVIDIEAILDQIRRIIDKAALAVQAVFIFTLFAGIVVLFAAVQSTLDQRRYESALLRTFGARKSTVLAGLATEFIVLGIAAGLFASIGATLVGGLAATQLFDLPYKFDPWLWLLGIASGALVVGASGLLATFRTVQEPPVNTLR